MPQIPVISNQVAPQALPTVRQEYLRDTRAESAGDALNNLGTVVTQVQKEENLKADRAAFMEADTATDNISNSLYQQAQSKQLKDAIGVGPDTLAEFDKQTSEITKGLKTPRQQRVYKEALNQQRANLQRSVDTHERQQTETYYAKSRESYAAQAHDNAVTYYNDPKRVEDEIAKQHSVVDQTPGLDDGMRADAKKKLASSTYADVIDRYLVNEQAQGADVYYKSVRGKVGGEAATHIENSIRVTRDRIEAKQRAQNDKREAAAVRAINSIDQQIASGVPATSVMWKEWESKVKGTEMASEFKDRQADEAEVQGVLRKPIADQVKFLQDKEAALKSGGGSVRQLTNYNRLKTAVTQNVKLLGDAPLQFNAVRTGAELEPLDVGALVNGEAGAQVADRLATLDGMRKQFGNVPQKVLLPQEASQLSAVLAQAAPKQQAHIFCGLYKSVGPEAYKVAMQQIAPDSPVRAIAGSLAAKQAQMTTKTHWFKPDEIAYSGDVSATMLQGEDMLNESKADKKTDGKPKLSLYLPESSTLQADFQNQVGNVFAGRPAAADVAFQAVKAYYVGRAAQTGRIAASNHDIDSGLIKEAITAALGSVVSYNGGDVLAPWGMDRSRFQDAAHAALLTEAKRRGMDEAATKALGGASLRNAGDSTYYVTQGRSFVTDKGKPIVITVQ